MIGTWGLFEGDKKAFINLIMTATPVPDDLLLSDVTFGDPIAINENGSPIEVDAGELVIGVDGYDGLTTITLTATPTAPFKDSETYRYNRFTMENLISNSITAIAAIDLNIIADGINTSHTPIAAHGGLSALELYGQFIGVKFEKIDFKETVLGATSLPHPNLETNPDDVNYIHLVLWPEITNKLFYSPFNASLSVTIVPRIKPEPIVWLEDLPPFDFLPYVINEA